MTDKTSWWISHVNIVNLSATLYSEFSAVAHLNKWPFSTSPLVLNDQKWMDGYAFHELHFLNALVQDWSSGDHVENHCSPKIGLCTYFLKIAFFNWLLQLSDNSSIHINSILRFLRSEYSQISQSEHEWKQWCWN